MQKINLIANNKELRAEFCELVEKVFDSMVEDNLSDNVIIPHLCGMFMTATWAGIITQEQADSLTLALLIDTCKE